MQTATVQIRVERTLQRAIDALIPTLTDHLAGDIAIMPSTMDHRDLIAEAVSGILPTSASPQVITPLSGADARRALVMPARSNRWTDIPMRIPGTHVASALLPTSLMNPPHRVIVTDVVEVARHGPFVLDLPARYVHPRQRLRLITDRERSDLMAEVASVVPITLAIVCLVLPEGAFVAATDDRIAAELVALALSERCLGTARSFQGPWEDAVVQRATELGLGVLLPAAIRLLPDGSATREPWADALVEHVRRRLGIPGTSNLRP
ncbi:MAG TPA: hypothetical protein VNZ58_11655 [Thermomicrobiales bacterium]|nr:hypothetical protein [Thermomicrobiales bacterium]